MPAQRLIVELHGDDGDVDCVAGLETDCFYDFGEEFAEGD